MRKSIRIFCLILAAMLVTGVAFFVRPVRLKAAAITPPGCEFQVTGDPSAYSWATSSNVLTITGDVTIEMSDAWTMANTHGWTSWDGVSLCTSTQQRIEIANSGAIHVTIRDIRISPAGGHAAISLANGANAVIHLEGKNSLQSGGSLAALHAPQGTTLTINAAAQSGYLCAKTALSSGGAGIGGGSNESGGTITITGEANILAHGVDGGAGIGGGLNGSGGSITISGNAHVTATGFSGGAGIGGGTGGTSGNIRLEDTCIITAESQSAPGNASGSRGGGAAIGGGADAGMTASDAINIGANVTLTAKGADGGQFEGSDFYAGGGAAIGAGGGSAANGSYAQGGRVLGTITIAGGGTRPGLSLTPGTGGKSTDASKTAGNGATVGGGGDAYDKDANANGGNGAAYQAAKPTVSSVTPSGTSVAANVNELAITFSGAITTTGTVTLDGVPLGGSVWDAGNQVIRYPLSLTAGKSYTVKIASFSDTNATMVEHIHTFTTASDRLFAPTDITPHTYTCVTGAGGSVQLTAASASPAAIFTAANPPAGVTLSASGLLTVDSSVAVGQYTFKITATNSEGSVTRDFTLTIESAKPTPTIKPTTHKFPIPPSGVKIGKRDTETYPTVTSTFNDDGLEGALSASITSSQIAEMLDLVEKDAVINDIFPRSTLEFIWNSDAPDISIGIDADALMLMADSGVDKFFVQTGSYQFAFDPDALRALAHKGDVTVAMTPYVPDESEPALNRAAGIRKAARVTVTADGEEISALPNGRMYGAIRYQLGRGESAGGLFACAVNANGNPAWIEHSGYSAGYVAWNGIGAGGVYGLGVSGAYRGMSTSIESLWIGPANAPPERNLPEFGQ